MKADVNADLAKRGAVIRSAWAIQGGAAAIARGVDRAIFGLACVLLVSLVVALFLQVLFRYVIHQPLAWTEEGARFLLVWFSMIAAVSAARAGEHFVFRWALLLLPGGARYWLRRFTDILVSLLLILILVESLDYLDVVANRTASGTGLNMRIPFAGICFGSAALLIIYLAEIVDAFLAPLTGRRLSLREVHEGSVYALLGTPSETKES